MAKIARILTIDGGGIRGVIPAMVLKHLEDQLGRPLASLFHMLAGTSTGGILAIGLARPQPLSAGQLVELYRDRGDEIFGRSRWRSITSIGGVSDEKYGHEPLERVLREYLGETRLSESTRDLLITFYEIERREPHFFKSWKAQGRHLDPGETARRRDFLLRNAARATSAAPTYFEPAPVRSLAGETFYLVDGGVYANNPAMCALASARRLYPNAEGFLVVSLGTGELQTPISYREAKDWGELGWLRPILSIIFDGVSDTVEYQLLQELGPQDTYVRLQVGLGPTPDAGPPPSDDIDDASAENLTRLQGRAEALVRAQGETLARLVERLSKPMTDAALLGGGPPVA